MTKSKTASEESYRRVRFTTVAFSAEMAVTSDTLNDTTRKYFASIMALGDQKGDLFVADLSSNKLTNFGRTGIAVTALCFIQVRRREVIVGLADDSVHCYNTGTAQLVARLPSAHKSNCHYAVSHATKPLAITTAQTEAILWDTENWERKRMLIGSNSSVNQVSFGPDGISVIGSFSDGSILFWTLETFALQWKITTDSLTGVEGPSTGLFTLCKSWFDVSKTGEYLAYASSESRVVVWNLFEKRLLHEIVIPSFQEKRIVQLGFLGTTTILSVLAESGGVIFIDVEKAEFQGQLKGNHSFDSFSMSPNGLLFASVLSDLSHVAVVLDIQDVSKSEGQRLQEMKPEEQAENVAVPTFHIRPLLGMEHQFNMIKLKRFLTYYGEFPSQYRTIIWRFVLKVPENRSSFEALLNQGTSLVLRDFRSRYPIKNYGVAKAMERVLSCLGHWSPIFEGLDYVPMMVFPFVKLFSKDQFAGFEVIMTIILNWCQKWWDYYPNPPIDCLDMLENLLGLHDPELLAHFVEKKITTQIYAWPLMQTLFTDVLTEPDWLRLWDHLVVNQPSFFYFVVLAYIVQFHTRLLDCQKPEDFEQFFKRKNAFSFEQFILLAYKLQRQTPKSSQPSTNIEPFKPVLKGDYPIFNSYPHFIVDYQNRVRDKIRDDEDEFIRRRKMGDEISRLAEDLRKDKSAWDSADWKMNEMIEKWWEQMMADEESRMKRKVRNELLDREHRVQALNEIANARKTFIGQQMSSSERHMNSLSKAVGRSEHKLEVLEDNDKIEKSLKEVEDEWLQRRSEMLKAREELVNLQAGRIERLVNQIKSE